MKSAAEAPGPGVFSPSLKNTPQSGLLHNVPSGAARVKAQAMQDSNLKFENATETCLFLAGVPNLSASLGHTGRRVVLGHT